MSQDSPSIMFWSQSTKGFYDPNINTYIPDDAVEITVQYWQELLYGQSNGKLIVADSSGYPILVDPAGPTVDQTIQIINNAIQAKLDEGAQKWGYADMVTAASYATSTNPQYAADAAALIGWRDEVWVWAYAKFPSVTAGEDPAVFMEDMPIQPTKPIV